MRPRQGGRVRHAEQPGRYGRILRLYELWDAEARRWELAAWVAFDGDGTDSLLPLRELVLVRRGATEGEVRAMTIEAAARAWAEAAQTRPPDYTHDAVVGGVRLHCYSACTQVILDGGQGGDRAEYGMVECFANIADTVTLIAEGDGEAQDDGRIGYGHACVALTPAEARWLGAWLTAQAERAERRRDAEGSGG